MTDRNTKTIHTVQEVIADTLRRSIVEGEYKPGDRLIQDELAERYGVSRIPVREALRTLSAEGLLTFHRRRGAIVTALSREDLQEVMNIRSVLEGMATRLAAERATPEDLECIREAFHRLEAARDDPALYFQRNSEFHAAILDAARSPRLKEMVMNIRNTVEPVARRYLIVPGRVHVAHSDHETILTVIENRDADAAERAAREHTLHVLAGILHDYVGGEAT
ncbi:MAG: GntR family transcriptional regulator [Chloroflexota bacterium]|nr:MAG: GntR family transcriptional regulator [Chloroflexota bacterium]